MYLKWINLKNQDNLPSLWTDTEYWIEWIAFNEYKDFLSISPGSWAIVVWFITIMKFDQNIF